jgi:hypothetical protein
VGKPDHLLRIEFIAILESGASAAGVRLFVTLASQHGMPEMFDQEKPAIVIQYDADILADTSKRLSGGNIVKTSAAYALE